MNNRQIVDCNTCWLLMMKLIKEEGIQIKRIKSIKGNNNCQMKNRNKKDQLHLNKIVINKNKVRCSFLKVLHILHIEKVMKVQGFLLKKLINLSYKNS
jgi:hypothetical protein